MKAEIIRTFAEQGREKIHVLTDFDGTLTKSYVDGEVPSVISILRNSDYISKDYAEKAHNLANHYKPIESNPNISIKDKKKDMQEWWTKHFELLINSGLNKKHLEKVVQDKRLQFRDGVPEFIKLLNYNKIPLVIISSSGIGETIPMFFKRENISCDNIYFIINYYEWDKKGNAIGIKKPIIHSMNKDEAIVKDYPFYNKIKNRKNVVLLGNDLGDLEMIKGFNYDNLLKIGFLDKKEKNFDVVLNTKDSFNYINKLMKEILR